MSGDLIGRNDELRVVERFLDDSVAGLSALLIEGEAGIGKTALWRAALDAAAARDYRVLTTRPGEVDARIALSALGDLLDDVADEVLAALPQPQRRALEVALLIEEPHAEPTDERAVAVGVLGALRSLAESDRLLIAVDDVQWLDPASAGALRFAARRLDAGHVRFLLAHRVDGRSQVPLDLDRALLPDRLQSLHLDPLSLGATQRLLDQHLATAFSRPVLHRLHELSGGNPFFALELGRALERGTIRLTPGERLPAALDVLVRDRLAALPSRTRRALATAAAASQPTTRLLAVVAPGALEPAVAAQVVELDGESIRFTHPLLAAAALASLAASDGPFIVYSPNRLTTWRSGHGTWRTRRSSLTPRLRDYSRTPRPAPTRGVLPRRPPSSPARPCSSHRTPTPPTCHGGSSRLRSTSSRQARAGKRVSCWTGSSPPYLPARSEPALSAAWHG